MKTIMSTLCVLALVLMVTPMAFATSSDAMDGVTVTITVTDPGLETDFTYDASPNVEVTIEATPAAYSITTANTLLGVSTSGDVTGMEYGTLSVSTGYAQRQKTTDVGDGPEVCTDEAALPGSDWTWMGGDGIGGS